MQLTGRGSTAYFHDMNTSQTALLRYNWLINAVNL